MKQISLPRAALLALLKAGTCEVRKPVAKSPAIQPGQIKCGWYYATDKYGYELGEEVFGFMGFRHLDPPSNYVYRFPWGGPASKVEIKGTGRTAEILAVEVRAAKKRYQWVITLKLIE